MVLNTLCIQIFYAVSRLAERDHLGPVVRITILWSWDHLKDISVCTTILLGTNNTAGLICKKGTHRNSPDTPEYSLKYSRTNPLCVADFFLAELLGELHEGRKKDCTQYLKRKMKKNLYVGIYTQNNDKINIFRCSLWVHTVRERELSQLGIIFSLINFAAIRHLLHARSNVKCNVKIKDKVIRKFRDAMTSITIYNNSHVT